MELGTATQTLKENNPGEYTLRFESSASFLFLSDKRSEISVFDVKENRLVPQQYRYKRTGTGKDRNTTIRFSEPDNQIVVNQNEILAWQDETDNQLFHLDIRRRLASGETRFSYDTINEKGKKDQETFAVTGNEKLTLPMGQIDTIKLHKVRENSTRETHIWLAPGLDYQMVRLRQLKDGEEQLDIQLASFTRRTD